MAADGFEALLGELFGYQRFEEEPGLARLIEDTAGRYPGALSDEELGQVNAAGEPGTGHEPPQLAEGPDDD